MEYLESQEAHGQEELLCMRLFSSWGVAWRVNSPQWPRQWCHTVNRKVTEVDVLLAISGKLNGGSVQATGFNGFNGLQRNDRKQGAG